MVKKIVHIEGHSRIGLDGGSLRQSFNHLLKGTNYELELEIRMGKSNTDTVSRYKENKAYHKYLLIDLDTEAMNRNLIIENLMLQHDNQVYFMVQQCEAWFLSQPNILDNHFSNTVFTDEYSSIDASTISNPSGKIKDIVSKFSNNTKKYSKVTDCSVLLKKLNIEKLQQDFSDVNNLINALAN